jgi:hypothetical protein
MLGAEQGRRHVVSETLLDTGLKGIGCSYEMDEPNAWVSVAQDVAIRASKCRTCKDAVVAGRFSRTDPGRQRTQPRPSVTVSQRLSGRHFGNVRYRVEVVGFR